jgi:hypothetical protein
MPIRINLLAEAKAEEEMRRRDPVKRAIWAGAILTGLFLLWSGYLQYRIIAGGRQLAAIDDQLSVQSKQYDTITLKERNRTDISRKLVDLQRIHTNRFLWGSVLNALQQSVVSDVQLVAFRGEQRYFTTDEVKAKVNEAGKITVFAKPGGVTERIHLEFDAKDSSPTPGDKVGVYKAALANAPFFQSLLGKTNEINLRSLSPPALDGESGKTMVMFTLDCRFPDRAIK